MRHALAALLTVLVSGATGAAQGVSTTPPTIAQVHGQVYEVTSGAEHSIVVSTSDGILVVDPLTRPTAQWLRERLGEMFPGVPVKYVVLTSPRVERIEGASVFAPAEVIAHRQFNGVVNEARQAGDPASYRYVRDVRSTFDERRLLSLGSHEILLLHPTDPRQKAATAVYVPGDKLAFIVDPLATADVAIPARTSVPELSQWLDRVTSIDFDTLMLGDGQRLDGPSLRARAAFLRDLLAAVTAGVENGRKPEEVSRSPRVTSHADAAVPGDREALVRGLYRSLVWWRLDLQGGMAYSHGSGVVRSCGTTDTCTADTSLPRGTVSAWLSRRRVALGVETGFGPQAWASQARTAYAEEFAQRQFQTSVLGRLATPRRDPFSFAFLGGVSLTHADTKGLSIVREAVAPTGGRFGIFEKSSRLGLVAGVDIVHRVSRSFDVSVPIRLTANLSNGAGERWISTNQVQVGFTLSRRLWQGFQ